MRSIRGAFRGPSVLQKTQRKRAVLFRTRFTTMWRSGIHISMKVDAYALNRRQCRFFLRCPVRHAWQGQRRHYDRNCECFYDVWNVKN